MQFYRLRRSTACIPLILGSLFLLAATTVSAQIVPRVVTGDIVGRWRLNDNVGVTGNGRTCPCFANPTPGGVFASGGALFYPGIGPFYKPILPANVAPLGNWATVTAGSNPGDPIVFAGSEFGLSTMSTIPGPTGTGMGFIISIMTSFMGQNDAGSLASGLGNGATTFNPLAVTIPSNPSFMTFNGGTTLQKSFPARPNSTFQVKVAPGIRQFGGALKIANNSPNNLVFADFVNGGNWSRINGSYGGVPIGHTGTRPAVQKFENTLNPALTKTERVKYWGLDWTTGMVSARDLVGNIESSWVKSGSDTTTAMGRRNISLVAPIMNSNPVTVTQGAASGLSLQYTWRMQFVPEPASTAGLAAGLGLLALVAVRLRTKPSNVG
jgi:hypothetical protein